MMLVVSSIAHGQVAPLRPSPSDQWIDPQPSWDVAQPTAPTTTVGSRYVEGEVLVGLVDVSFRETFLAEADRRSHSLLGEIPRLRLLKLSCAVGRESEVVAELSALAGVAFAETNGLGSGAGVEELDDPCVPDQWHLKNDGSTGGVPGADLDVNGAWSITKGNSGIVVAVLDSGIELDHPEFIGRLLQGYDFVDEDPDPTGLFYHGIFQSGLIGAIADNGFAGTGLDQSCMILPVKVVNDLDQATAFDVCEGIDYAVAAGARVINMSLQGFVPEEVFKTALPAAHQAGCILVAAAGNGGIGYADKSWPGASPDTFSVGATDSSDLRVGFSGTGKALDFMGPGEDIYSCTGQASSGQCSVWGGTSMACALTSGVTSLLLSVRGDLSQEEIYALLAAGAKDQIGPSSEDPPGWDKIYGYGRISAGASLRALTRMLASEGMHGVPGHVDYHKGGHQLIVIRVDPKLRGSPWITLGSVTGSVPGMWLGHVHVPLNNDAYFVETLAGSDVLLHPAFGIVPDDGVILQSVDVPKNWKPGFDVQQLDHAVVVAGQQMIVFGPVSLVVDH